MEDIQAAITDYARYHETFLTAPEPPRPWDGFEVRLEGLITERRKSWSKRARHILRGMTPFRYVWASAVAAALVVGVAIFELNRPPSVSAAELLQKASAREANVVSHKRLLVKTPSHTFARAAVMPANGNLPESEAPSDIEAMFVKANYSWENPVSATSFAAWRAHLRDKRDEVTVVHTEEARGLTLYRIQTNTRSSHLEEATLTLRANDYDAVSGVFRFRDNEQVEMTAEPDEPATSIRSEPAVVSPQQSTRRIVQGETASRPTMSEPAQELRVMAALRSIEADLGEQIELSRDNSQRLVIAGTAVPPQRQDLLRTALADVPGVILHFHDPRAALTAGTDSLARDQASSAAANTLAPALRLQLERTIGGASALETFTNRALEASAAAMARGHALRKLADRFPRDIEARLEDNDRATLLRLREEHAYALAQHVKELERLVGPLLLSLGAPAGQTRPLPESRRWQEATQNLFAALQGLDRLLTMLLTGADAGPPETVIKEANLALNQLTAEIARTTEDMQREER